MIKVFITGKGYNIEYNGKTIVKCNEALVPFKELLQHLGYDLSTIKVEIYDGAGFTTETIVNETVSEDDVIASMNETFVSPNLGKYRETFIEDNTSRHESTKQTIEKEKPNTAKKYEPVGSVECPVEGDLIYVDGIQGVLSTITGGIGTVMTIYHSNDTISIDTDDNYDQYEENNILVELEEVPGHYFSWSVLRSQQSVLKTKYGYKPVCKL